MAGKRTCCVFNGAAHYRACIFKLMDRELACDFYMGNHTEIVTMDYNELKGFKGMLDYVPLFKSFYWQKGAVNLCFKRYENYLITGEPFCVSTWLILILNLLMGKKTYLWTHGWYGRESVAKTMVKKVFFGMAEHIILYGEYARDLMIKEGFRAEKLSCIYNSLDYDNQRIIRKSLQPSTLYQEHFKNDYPNLMFVGRLTSGKKLEWLLEALCMLSNEGRYFNLTLIGDGDAREGLKNEVRKLGLENNVWFYGACYDETELADMIYNADLCVSPGNVGLTAIHSLTFGTPVITHNNFPYQGPEFESIAEGITGIFFEYGNIRSLSGTILRWFETPRYRDVTRKHCYEIIESKYNPYVQIELLKRLLLK